MTTRMPVSDCRALRAPSGGHAALDCDAGRGGRRQGQGTQGSSDSRQQGLVPVSNVFSPETRPSAAEARDAGEQGAHDDRAQQRAQQRAQHGGEQRHLFQG
jgi:hypothetical protein